MAIFIVISSMFCIYALGMILESTMLICKSIKARKWPTTVGIIQNLSIQAKVIESPRYIINHQVKVTYNYVVYGEIHTGSQIAFGYHGGDNLASQQAILAKLKSDPKILVRYNPNIPRISILSFGIHNTIKREIADAFMILSFMSIVPFLEFFSGTLSICGLIIFICSFIIREIINHRIDNKIIKNICSCN